MAAKIVRRANKIALLGAPTSAAALAPGHEEGPRALREAGLIERLRACGYEVEDLGDDPIRRYEADEESPRARNIRAVVAALESLKPRVEQALKSGALPLILGGDCSIALATIAAARRYYRSVGMIYMDADADFQTPATTSSGCVDGMVVSHLTGRGAAELVRFWGEPPLVREPDLALFGTSRLDPLEEEALRRSAIRQFPADEVRRKSAESAAALAIERIHAASSEFVLHIDVDVIAGFQATNSPSADGLRFDELRQASCAFVRQPRLGAIELTAYNPAKDPDGSAARQAIELLSEGLALRLREFNAAAERANAPKDPGAAPAARPEEASEPARETSPPGNSAARVWPSEALAGPAQPPEAPEPPPSGAFAARDEGGPPPEAHEPAC